MKYRDVPTRADQQAFVDAFHEFKDLVARGQLEVPEEKAGYEVFTFSWLMQRLGWQPKRVNLMLRHVRREFHDYAGVAQPYHVEGDQHVGRHP